MSFTHYNPTSASILGPGLPTLVNPQQEALLIELLQRLCTVVGTIEGMILKGGSPSGEYIELYRSCVSELIDQRKVLYSDEKFGQAYTILISNISRLLCERFAHLEATGKHPLVVHNSRELRWAEEFRERGFFTFKVNDDTLSWCKKTLDPHIQELMAAMRSGDSSREACSTNRICSSVSRELGRRLIDEGIPQAVSAGIACEVHPDGFALELSVPKASWWYKRYPLKKTAPAQTAYFHRDETISVPKAVLYLSPVDDESGPFELVPESIRAETDPVCMAASRVVDYPIRWLETQIENSKNPTARKKLINELYRKLPAVLRIDSHFGFLLEDESDASKSIMNNKRTITGSAGDGICFDGYRLLHRGGLAQAKPRLALQIMLPTNRHLESRWLQALMVPQQYGSNE